MENPKVSICVVTYNHIRFIRKCLDSLVNQIADFDFEILVSDDCSKDGTQDILMEYERLYPNIVTVFFQEKNLGAEGNFVFIHQKPKGKYVVHMDGDDYTLPGKLQKQADYLDENLDCNIVWHRMNIIDSNEQLLYEDNYLDNGVVFKKFNIIDLIANVTIGFNSSKMYRGNFEFKDRLEYYDIDFSFNVLKLLNMKKFAAFASESALGVYRSSIGISVTQNYKIKIKIYKWLLRFYRDKIIDRSLISAKILLLLLSDIKHLKKTMFYGLYALGSTLISFNIKSLKFINSKKLALSTMYKIIDEKFNI